MAQIVLKDASISIGGVELADRSNSVEVNYEIESVEVTAFGGNRSFVGGLQNNTCTVELQQDFAATETEATIFPLVGTQLTLIFKPTSEAVGADNPSYTITGAYLASHTPIAAAVGELAMTSLTFTGGTLVKAVA